jgi:biotin carboxylase
VTIHDFNSEKTKPRLLLLAGKLGYQTRSFLDTARRLGAEVLIGSDRCHQLDDPWADGAIALHFEDPREAAGTVLERSKQTHIDGIIALGDRPIETAALVAQSLELPYNSPESVCICRSKLRQREVLHAAGLPVPEFFAFELSEPLDSILPSVKYPCVVKPLSLSGSQGVIRADNADEFTAAVERNRRLLATPEIRAKREPELDRLLVEQYISGGEVAVEGLLTNGKLRILAIFDKPDPLNGPYFEETIYVTPSRLSARTQRAISECAQETVRALGLTEGPVHAEFRIPEKSATPWILEAAPRPIGGLCAQALRFGDRNISLEELLLRHALRLPGSDALRESRASGVMMIPVPITGVYEKIEGVERALKIPGTESVEITARPHDVITAWPEGGSYLGFIFARAEKPESVESALRRSHLQLRFTINTPLRVEQPNTQPARASA